MRASKTTKKKQSNFRMNKEKIARDRMSMEDEIRPGDNTHVKRMAELGERSVEVGAVPSGIAQCGTSSISRRLLQRALEQKTEQSWGCPACGHVSD